MSARRIHFRPPGVKTGSTIGPLGPFRGTLGIHWVIGSIAVGLLIVLAATLLFARFGAPSAPYRLVGELEAFPLGTAREVLGGVYVGVTNDGDAVAVAEPVHCPLQPMEGGYRDCLDLGYALDGSPLGKGDPLSRLPVEVYRGRVYVDPTGGDPTG